MTTPQAVSANLWGGRRALARIDHHLAQFDRESDGPCVLRSPGSVDPATPDPDGDGLADLRLLSLLRRPLERMAVVVARRWGDREEAEAMVVAVAWEVVRTPPTDGPPNTEAVVDAIWTRVRQASGLRRLPAPELVALPDDLELTDWSALEPSERFSGLLVEAVSRGVLSGREAWIIGRTRILERPLTEVALDLGHSYEAVRKERRRAEDRLRDFALAYSSEPS